MLSRPGHAIAVLGLVLGVLLTTFAPPPAAHAQAPASCPPGVSLSVAAPEPEAPTTAGVSLSLALPLKPASANDAASFHLHYFVDTPAPAAGTAIPSGDTKIIHSAALSQDLGPLTAGTHTVTVVLGQSNHVACEARGSTTFIVGQTAAAPVIPPKSGNAGLAGSSTSALVVVLLVAVAVAVVVAARLWTPRNRP